MRQIKFYLVIAISVLAAARARAQSMPAYSNEWLNIGAGARGLSMGGAEVASVNDATAGYWNPAGLAAVRDGSSFSAMHADYFSGIGMYDYLAAAIPLNDDKRTLGITALRFGVDNIPNTLTLVDPVTGEVNYNNISNFSVGDYAALLSYGQMVKNTQNMQISFGANVKVLYQYAGSFTHSWGLGIDAGVMIHTPTWRFGAVVRDLTTTYNAWTSSLTDEEKQDLFLAGDSIPAKSTVELTKPSLILGGGYNIKFSSKFSILAELNAHLTFDEQRNVLVSNKTVSIDPNFGLEANIANHVFIRGGIANMQRVLSDKDSLNQKKTWLVQPSVGAGVRLGNVTIDYAFVELANQSSALYTNVFSLRLDLVSKRHKLSFIK